MRSTLLRARIAKPPKGFASGLSLPSIGFASERLMTALLVRLESRLSHLEYCSFLIRRTEKAALRTCFHSETGLSDSHSMSA